MERRVRLLPAALTAARAAGLVFITIPPLLLMGGCSPPEATVTIRYYHPAAMPLATTLRTLVVGQFTSDSEPGRKYAAAVKEKLSVALARAAGGGRFQLLNPKQLTRRADAVIYGTVSLSRPAERGSGRRLGCAEVAFIVVDVESGRTVLTDTISRRGQIEGLIDQCVDAFIADITPHEEVIPVVLADVKDTIARKGNALAARGRYDEALDCYTRALLQSGDEHGILFNAGVIHEIKGNLVRAAGLYARALKLRSDEKDEKCAAALRRVRRELKK